jgi:hypothetical protein
LGSGKKSASADTDSTASAPVTKITPASSTPSLSAQASSVPSQKFLASKVEDVQKLLNGIEQNIKILTTSIALINDAIACIEEAGGFTVRARDTLQTDQGYEGNKDRLSELETRFLNAVAKINPIVDKANPLGVNLLRGQTLHTALDMTGKNNIETHGLNISSEALEFRTPSFINQVKVQDSRIDVMNAIDMAITLRHVLASDLILLQTRQEFSSATIEVMREGLEPRDLNDESAKLLALEVRKKLALSDEPLVAEAQQFILQQFSKDA